MRWRQRKRQRETERQRERERGEDRDSEGRERKRGDRERETRERQRETGAETEAEMEPARRCSKVGARVRTSSCSGFRVGRERWDLLVLQVLGSQWGGGLVPPSRSRHELGLSWFVQ